MRKRWRVLLPAAVVGLVAAWWLGSTSGTPAPPARAAAAAPPAAAASTPSGARAGAPFSAQGLADRAQQLALWRDRLDRARRTLAAYELAARYPHDSRPADEHRDRWLAHPPIVDEQPLVTPGGTPAPGVHLRTSQQAIFASANDSVLFTVTAVDDSGATLPLRVLNSSAYAPIENSPRARPISAPTVTQPFVDDGTQGDASAGDGTWTSRLAPAAEGFGSYAGTIRTELLLQVGETEGRVVFDVVYTPEIPATWAGGVHETLLAGSLELLLPVQVAEPGRYVVTGRVDDADGHAFAFVSFNDELGSGAQQVRLPVFGLLVRDARPAFPLVLHDVEGFLLKPDAYPDRAPMPPLDGTVYTTRRYALSAFGNAAWTSEEKSRYVAEYGADVAQAQAQVDRLSP